MLLIYLLTSLLACLLACLLLGLVRLAFTPQQCSSVCLFLPVYIPSVWYVPPHVYSVGAGHRTDWKVVELTGKTHGRTWKGHG